MKNRKKVLSFLLAGVLTLGCFPVTAGATNNSKDGTKPADGTTVEQPFPKTLFLEEHNSSKGFTRFRIPALVTAGNGALIAATDIRWDICGDGAGLDTAVSRSTDNGATWSYTVANYLGDNGNRFNRDSTAFIDPALLADGDTIYLACDLLPAGLAVANAARYPAKAGSTGYDTNGNLLLALSTTSVNGLSSSTARAAASYDYHLEKKADATSESCYEIKNNSTSEVVDGDYTIDDHFNIKSADGAVDTNLFCGDTPYFQFPTDFLYITKSTDNGATWSAPQLVDAKNESEQVFLIGPGRGITTSTGRLIFPCYQYTSGVQRTSTIYSDDDGTTWHRGATVSGNSSEAVITEADGRLYLFVRMSNAYYISEDDGLTWSEPKETGFKYNNNCQLSAITYSKKVNGKTAILFAGPSDTSARNSGRIWVGLVQDDGSLQWQDNPYVVNDGTHYAYSCITETSDAQIGLLYEDEDEQLEFDKIAIDDIVNGAATSGVWVENDNGSVVNSSVINTDATASYVVRCLDADADITVSSSNRAVLDATYADGRLTLTSKGNVTGLKQVKVTVKAGEESFIMNVTITDAERYKVVSLEKDETRTLTVKDGNYADADTSSVDTAVAGVTVTGKDVQDTYEKTVAQIATAMATFDGATVDLSKCMYTLESGSDSYTYKVKATAANGNGIYLGPKASSTAGIPNVTTAANITFEKNPSDATFSIMDNSSGGGGKYLYFHSTDATKLHFDRQNVADDNCWFELYTPSTSAEDYDLINGFKKITSEKELKAGVSVLIVTKADAQGNRYILLSTTGSQKYNHVAKLVKQTAAATEEAAYPGTSTAVFGDTNVRGLSECQYTFKKISNGVYAISGHTADGATTFVTMGTVGIPNKTAKANITVADVTNSNGKVSLYDGSASRYLYFWRDASKLHYDRQRTLDTTACAFELFKKSATASADSPIKGYEKITGASAIEDGGQYLIAAEVDGTYYVMNPTLDHSNFRHVAKVTNTIYRNPAAEASTTINFTGVAAGTTSVQIGDVVYYVIVTDDAVECTHSTTVVLDAKEATCTEKGSTGEVVCVDCGTVVQEAQEIAAKGHTFGEWVTVKEPTTTEEGSKERNCSVCQTKETETIAKLPDKEDPDQPATPSAPENVASSEVTKDSIKITWDAPAATEGIAGYKIYVNGAVYATDISKDAVGYTLSGLKSGETYQIQVVAVGTDEHATEYAAAALSVTTKSENKDDNNGGNDNNANNGNAGNNKPSDNKNTTTDKNQNSTVNKAAKTGDMTNVVFPAAVMLLAGAVVAGVLFRRKWME